MSNVEKLFDLNAVEHREMRNDIKEIITLLSGEVDREEFNRLESRVSVLEKAAL